MPLEKIWNPAGYSPARPARLLAVTKSAGGTADGSLYIFTIVDHGYIFGGRVGDITGHASLPHLGTWGDAGAAVCAASNKDGRIEVFLIGTKFDYWHLWETAPNSAQWAGWAALSNPSGKGTVLAAGQNQDGRLEVFGGGRQGVIHAWQDPSGPFGGWSDWAALGSPSDTGGGTTWSVAVGRNADDRLEVFQIANNRDVWHNWQTSPNNGWSGWASLGAPPPGAWWSPAAGRNADGRLELFVIGGDYQVWHIWQQPSPGGWSGWAQLGTLPYVFLPARPLNLAVGSDLNGGLVVYATNGDHQLYLTSQTTDWGGWGIVEANTDVATPVGFDQGYTVAAGHDNTQSNPFVAPFYVAQDGAIFRWRDFFPN